MRLLLFTLCLLPTLPLYAQNHVDWIAPEGRILNYRTLNWDDFQEKQEKEIEDKLAEQNLRALAYICPAIYFTAKRGETQENGRIKFDFLVKCAFQTRSFAREATKKDHSNYVLIHEQDHYDIALVYANKLQAELSSRDYSKDKYQEEVDKIADDNSKKYHATQMAYDHEVNPDGREEKEKQYLWDMRIKKCMENNTDEYFASPETVVQTVKLPGQTVKRRTGEPAGQFVVRCRPLYTEFPQEMTSKIVETTEWTTEPAVIAFYTQKYYIHEDGAVPKDNFRTLAYIFIPNGKDTYKRVIIDTFVNDGRPVKIAATFFANVDSDQTKELVIVAASPQKETGTNGTLYINKVYDNVTRLLPARLRKLDDVAAKITGGFEGVKDGKPSTTKFKTEKDIREALGKMDYK